jgi:replicative DNA helicase
VVLSADFSPAQRGQRAAMLSPSLETGRSTGMMSSTSTTSTTEGKKMVALAQGDVYWDEIKSIEPAGEAEVYDLTVEGLHNFVAADIVVHNSIEQDADIVMFIFREDKYDEDSEKKGIAEIIVAKHRNGPVGSINLRFFDRTARFADLELYQEPGG